jgi:uncharacterized protein YbaR (Trm112 family)
MFIEVIDTLRCPVDHRDSWLVASIAERDDRLVREGLLGCPVCGREYPIVRGVAWFGVEPASDRVEPPAALDDEGGAMRAGAFLAPAEGSTIVLAGSWGAHAPALAGLMPLRIFAVNPDVALEDSERVAIVRTSIGLPFAPRAVRGIALDERATQQDVVDAARVLADGARLAAPASLAVPPELSELARDDAWWVAEKRGALVGLRRA